MGVPDMLLFAFLALVDACVLIHLHRRRQRRQCAERMLRSLRWAVQREIGNSVTALPEPPVVMLQRAS